MTRRKQSFSTEYRAKAVSYVTEQNKSSAGAARELGIGAATRSSSRRSWPSHLDRQPAIHRVRRSYRSLGGRVTADDAGRPAAGRLTKSIMAGEPLQHGVVKGRPATRGRPRLGRPETIPGNGGRQPKFAAPCHVHVPSKQHPCPVDRESLTVADSASLPGNLARPGVASTSVMVALAAEGLHGDYGPFG
jgi:hypothetical protein